MRSHLIVIIIAVASACASSKPDRTPVRPRPEDVRPPTELRDDSLADRGWASFEAPAHFIVIPLPDRDGWIVDRRSGSWLTLIHAASESELRIIGWRQDVVANRDGCERDGRTRYVGFPEIEPDTVLEERFLAAPEGFDTAVRATVQRHSPDRLEAMAFAVGANVRRCVAVVFETHAAGSRAEAVIADRLRLIIDGVLARARTWTVENRTRTSAPMFLR